MPAINLFNTTTNSTIDLNNYPTIKATQIGFDTIQIFLPSDFLVNYETNQIRLTIQIGQYENGIFVRPFANKIIDFTINTPPPIINSLAIFSYQETIGGQNYLLLGFNFPDKAEILKRHKDLQTIIVTNLSNDSISPISINFESSSGLLVTDNPNLLKPADLATQPINLRGQDFTQGSTTFYINTKIPLPNDTSDISFTLAMQDSSSFITTAKVTTKITKLNLPILTDENDNTFLNTNRNIKSKNDVKIKITAATNDDENFPVDTTFTNLTFLCTETTDPAVNYPEIQAINNTLTLEKGKSYNIIYFASQDGYIPSEKITFSLAIYDTTFYTQDTDGYYSVLVKGTQSFPLSLSQIENIISDFNDPQEEYTIIIDSLNSKNISSFVPKADKLNGKAKNLLLTSNDPDVPSINIDADNRNSLIDISNITTPITISNLSIKTTSSTNPSYDSLTSASILLFSDSNSLTLQNVMIEDNRINTQNIDTPHSIICIYDHEKNINNTLTIDNCEFTQIHTSASPTTTPLYSSAIYRDTTYSSNIDKGTTISMTESKFDGFCNSAILLKNSKLSLTKTTIVNAMDSGAITLNNCYFEFNDSIIYNCDRTTTPPSSFFPNDIPHFLGGAILLYNSQMVFDKGRIYDCNVTHSTPKGSVTPIVGGGAIALYCDNDKETKLTFSDGEISSNHVKTTIKDLNPYGGAIYIGKGCSMFMYGNAIIGVDDSSGVATHDSCSNYAISGGSSLAYQSYSGYGGAIYNEGDLYLGYSDKNTKTTLNKGIYKNISLMPTSTDPDASGGAIYSNSNITIDSGNIIDNNSSAIICKSEASNKATLTISGGTFRNNYGNSGAAILLNNYTQATIKNCNFLNNKAKFSGGAICLAGYGSASLTVMTKTNFLANEVIGNSNNSSGGAISINYSNDKLILDTSDDSLDTIVFASNKTIVNNASNTAKGGAIYCGAGGIIETLTSPTSQPVEFKSNFATSNGGAIALYSCNKSTLKNYFFEDNSCDNLGNDFYIENSSIQTTTTLENITASMNSQKTPIVIHLNSYQNRTTLNLKNITITNKAISSIPATPAQYYAIEFHITDLAHPNNMDISILNFTFKNFKNCYSRKFTLGSNQKDPHYTESEETATMNVTSDMISNSTWWTLNW